MQYEYSFLCVSGLLCKATKFCTFAFPRTPSGLRRITPKYCSKLNSEGVDPPKNDGSSPSPPRLFASAGIRGCKRSDCINCASAPRRLPPQPAPIAGLACSINASSIHRISPAFPPSKCSVFSGNAAVFPTQNRAEYFRSGRSAAPVFFCGF